jgi:LysM repeat protein
MESKSRLQKSWRKSDKKKERWGVTILAFFAIVGIFAFLLTKGGGPVVSDELVLVGPHGKTVHNGVLYNYHPIRSETSRASSPAVEHEGTDNAPASGLEPSGLKGSGCSGFIYHKVQSGDSLWKIAKKYNADMGDIVRENSILDPNMIYAGATLKITLKLS